MTTRFSRRTLLGTTFAGLSTLALAGCGVGEDTADVELSNKEVTLRFAWWGSDSRHDLTNQVIQEFQKENPKIKVKGEFVDWVGYWDRIATTFAANDAADVIQMDELYLRTYADRGSLMDLAKVKEYLDSSGFSEATLATGQSAGTQYALPTGNNSLAVVANRTAFEKLGIDLPDDKTWTWDEFGEVSAEISAKSDGDVIGSGALGMDSALLNIYARQHGNSLFDDEGQVTLKPELLAEFWDRSIQLAGKGQPSVEASVEQLTAPLNSNFLVLGKQALNFNYSSQLPSLQAGNPKAEFVLLQMPQSADGSATGYSYKSSMYWSIASRTEHPAEAAKLVDYMVNSPVAAKILGTDRGIPANADTLAAIRSDLDAPSEAAAKFNEQVEPLIEPPPALTPAGASDINAMLQRAAQEAFFGRQSTAEAAQKFVDELTTAVDNAAS
ncbi:ABC transporter substrate-binding protein [Kineosporia babensis]|uniref:Extracellular solute-binding protein n=1 Tax=Kineosporia babensis TaxID=499548 RepID=A0A9X1NMQ1_9ACTN|nr:extracellular solute-binding protein [Kineosporia babensis]MCD5316589.1 extracellular solute-binding protein [Kineosporia babensis]